MDVGVISDIHGDIEALDIVLNRLDHYHKVDMILCGGDLTGYGKYSNEVIERIRERKIPTVRGNHDAPSKDISPENAEYLRQLDLHWHGELDGIKVFMCHGRPGINFIGLHPEYTEDDDFMSILQDFDAHIVIAGHTHIPMFVHVANGYVVNPGCVYSGGNIEQGVPGTSHSYGVLRLPDLAFDIFDLTKLPGTLWARG